MVSAQACFDIEPGNGSVKERMAKSDRHQTDEATREYAPPACILDDVDPAYSGISYDEDRVSDIFAWRKAERQRLIDQRKTLSIAQREDYACSVSTYPNHVRRFWPLLIENEARSGENSSTACAANSGMLLLL